MDEIGNYLYIVIFVGIVIFNILKALRKQQAPVPAPNFPENHPYSTGEEDDLRENPAPVFRRERMTHQPISHQSIQNQPKTAQTVKVEPKKKHTGQLNEKDENKNISVAFGNAEDARRAFIYSEIWNRKY
ncbi:MAG: hypothetical protein LBR52_05810 [Prevotellaceae bacterium]|jgi:hypothetical protein|nr:hypothetical protein [Prevotellaceae bacterium]